VSSRPTAEQWQCVACLTVAAAPASSATLVCATCGHDDGTRRVATGEVVNQDPSKPTSGKPNLLHREQLRLARRLVRPGAQVVDVGCSSGAFLWHACRELPISQTSYGIEISAPNAEVARQAGLRVEASLAEIEPRALVTFWQSAEHFPVPDLVELLVAIRERAADVSLLISVPNVDSVQWRMLRDRWTYADPDAHYSQFSRDSLRRVLRRAGWRDTAWRRSPVYGLFGALQSSLNLLRPRNELYQVLKRGEGSLSTRMLVGNGVAAVVTAPVTAGLAVFEVSPRRGGVLTVECQPA